jgi:predicted NAD/FAD-dependent oxidoreductase
VLTAPAPQSLALLSGGEPGGDHPLASDATLAALAGVDVVPSFSVLVRSAGPDDVTAPLTMPSDEALAATDLTQCHVRHAASKDAPAALTLQAGVEFSASVLDGDRDAAAHELAAQASALVGAELVVVHVHGWRYAQVAAGIDRPALRDDTAGPPLVLAGDLFEAYGDAPAGVRPEGVERAFHSGHAAAALLDVAGNGEGP